VAALGDAAAATVAVPAHDTILRVRDETVVEISDRSELWHAQTPQGFHLETLRAAYGAAGDAPDYTDDCSVVARHLPDVAIAVVPGSPQNLKVTHPGDAALAERLLRERSGATQTSARQNSRSIGESTPRNRS
jgi:2-C-methyl-D-erythritol 4-phosphate cytidylyltransferase